MFTKSQILSRKTYKTGDVGKLLGITNQSVIRYCNSGILSSHRTECGHRRIRAEDLFQYLETHGLGYDDTENNKHDVIYARVSTHKQANRGDLDRQVDKVKLFAINHNVQNLIVKTDIGSGLNDNRKGLSKLIEMVQKGKVNRIFVLYKDRLTRFGFKYLEQICAFHNVQIIFVSDEIDNKPQSEELAEDIIALIHSFSGNLYGLRHRIKSEIDCDEETS